MLNGGFPLYIRRLSGNNLKTMECPYGWMSLIKISRHATLASFAVSKSDCTETLLMPSFCVLEPIRVCTEILLMASFSAWNQSRCRTFSFSGLLKPWASSCVVEHKLWEPFWALSQRDAISRKTKYYQKYDQIWANMSTVIEGRAHCYGNGVSIDPRSFSFGFLSLHTISSVQENLVHVDFPRAIS